MLNLRALTSFYIRHVTYLKKRIEKKTIKHELRYSNSYKANPSNSYPHAHFVLREEQKSDKLGRQAILQHLL